MAEQKTDSLAVTDYVSAAVEFKEVTLAHLTRHMALHKEMVVKYQAQATNCVVSSPESHKAAADIGTLLKNSLALLDDLRDSIVRPHNEFVDMVNAEFKKIAGPADKDMRALAERINRYVADEKRKIEEAQRKAAEEVERQKREYEAKVAAAQEEAKKTGTAPPAIEQPPAPPPAAETVPDNTVHGNLGKTVGRTTWTWKVIDAAIVPRDMLIVDEKKLNTLARGIGKGEPPKIPGIEFEKKTTQHF